MVCLVLKDVIKNLFIKKLMINLWSYKLPPRTIKCVDVDLKNNSLGPVKKPQIFI